MVIVSLDSPSCEVRLNDPESGGLIVPINSISFNIYWCFHVSLDRCNCVFWSLYFG
jgi:hypothetical protein